MLVHYSQLVTDRKVSCVCVSDIITKRLHVLSPNFIVKISMIMWLSTDNRASWHAYLSSLQIESRILKATTTRDISGRNGKKAWSNSVTWLMTFLAAKSWPRCTYWQSMSNLLVITCICVIKAGRRRDLSFLVIKFGPGCAAWRA